MKRLSLVLFFSLFGLATMIAQSRTITGTVSDQDGEVLIGATILVKGTSTGTVTDFDGAYSIQASAGDVLVFSYTGFTTQEATVGASNVLDVALEPGVTIDEVVVTGYSTELRREVTSAITSVKAEEIEGLPVQSFDRAIQGKVSGVLINNTSGAPGGAATIRIRGQGSISAGNAPLVIVDGVQLSGGRGQGTQGSSNVLASINPNDIESIEILKDAASAAIYGAQGANGIILVTTKTGSREGKPQFNLSFQEGIVEPMNLYEMMNSQQYADIRRQAYINAGLGEETPLELYGDPNDPNLPYYDWTSEIWRDASFRTAEFSFSGGSKSADYFASFSYNLQEGQINPTQYERLTARFNLNADLTDKLSMSLRSSTSWTRNFGVSNGGGFFVNVAFGPSFWSMPVSPARDENGDFNPYPLNGEGHSFRFNVLENALKERRIDRTLQNISSLGLNLELAPNLIARGVIGVDFINNKGLNSRPASIPFFAGIGGQVSNTDRVNFNWNAFTTLTYNFSLNDIHDFTVLGGFEYKAEDYELFDATGRGFADPSFLNLGNAADPFDVGGFQTLNRRAGFFGSVKYAFNDKYIANATVRYDGSSRFGTKNRWGLFYSGSVGWRIGAEPFLANVDWLTELKIRASYGITGNSAIGDFAALPVFGTSRQYLGAPGLAPTRLANDLLGWEEAEQIDLGIDYALFDNRIYGTVDFWIKNNNELLLNTQIPSAAGIANSTITENVGSVQNRGIDIELTTVVLNTNGFRWSLGGTLSFQENEVRQLNGGRDTIFSGNFPQLIVGEPLSFYYLLDFAGVNPANGRAMVYDQSGVPTYNPGFDDARIFDGAFADYFGGVRTEFSYKGFSLMGFLQFQGGNKVFNTDLYALASASADPDNQLVSQADYWRQPGDITNVHAPIQGGVNQGVDQTFGFIGTTRFLSDGSYMRLKEVRASYQFPRAVLSRIGLGSLSIYAQALNLITWTEYDGIDPEVQGQQAANGNSTSFRFPLGRQYSAGINLTF